MRTRTRRMISAALFTLALAIVYLLIVVILPTLALIVAGFRKFLFIRDFAALFDVLAKMSGVKR